ncbi:MAG: Kazal-type serine protease inhibitor domain-containing protein [Candidatus Woesearchaeota archaeon]
MNLLKTLIIIALALIVAGCAQDEPIQACTAEWRPVCGVDGQTYGNACHAQVADVEIAFEGECEEQPQEIVDAYENIVPSDCTTWFDGCNNCQVGEDGQLACTRMYCDELQEPQCLAYDGEDQFTDAYGNVIPPNCTAWFDGCNNCQVGEDGLLACTLMYCEVLQEPQCLSYESEQTNNWYTHQNSTLAYNFTIDAPTPCHFVTVDEIVMESYPEQIRINVELESSADMCAQVITPREVSGQIEGVSQQATVQVYVQGEPYTP